MRSCTMDTDQPGILSPADRAAIDDEVAEITKRRPSRDPQLPGCLVAFAGMLLLTLTPALGRWIEISREASLVLLMLAAAGLFGGAVVALYGGSVQTRSARRESEEAVAPILAYAEGSGDRADAVRAAVRLLSSAVVSPGAAATYTFRPDHMARRLGPDGARLVRAVEQYRLATDRQIPPVFTSRDVDAGE